MKIKHIILSALLALVLSLSGCGEASPADETIAPIETATPVIKTQPSPVQLTNDGEAVYPLVHAESAGRALRSLLQQTIKRLKNDMGIKFERTADNTKGATIPDSNIPEILFGTTNRPETLAVAKQLGYGGYAVTVEGEKIVVYGSTYDAQEKAADAFFSALTKNETGELVLKLPVGGIMEAGEESFFVESDGSDYVIVADEANKEAANTLQTALSKKYGYTLPIREPQDAETAHEILLGDCDRKETDTVLEAITSPTGYQIKLIDEKVVLVGKSSYSTAQAVDYFLQNYVENAAVLQIPKNMAQEHSGVELTNAEYVELTAGADIRIMSFNLLAELWNDQLPVEGRDEITATVLLTYLPDVIGLQEATHNWYERLVPMVKEQYTFVNEKTNKAETNFSGMAYNHHKIKLITDDCELFSKGNNGNMRLMNWALFETISDGKRFVVINTHLDIDNSVTPKNAYRLVQAKEMGEKVLALQKEYNCPVIITGDYNCSQYTDEYKLFIETAAVKDAQWDSAVAVNNTYVTYHKVRSVAAFGETSIDHITYTEGAESLFYMNHIEAPICNASDHNPIMADFRLNKEES